MLINKKNSLLTAAGVIILLLIIYVVWRAIALPIVHDEALTYLANVLGKSYQNIFSLNSIFPANNHLFNTVAVKAATDLFGLHVPLMRLPSLLAFLIYLASLGWLLRLSIKGWWPLGLLVVASHPFVLDFFSLARGYAPALALSFLALALCFAYFFQRRDTLLILSSGAAAAAAVWFNFSFLNLALALIIIWPVAWWLERPAKITDSRAAPAFAGGWRRFIWLMPGLLAILSALPLIFKLRAMGELTVGGVTSFWADTVMSSIGLSLFGRPWLANIFIFLVVLVMTMIPITWLVPATRQAGRRTLALAAHPSLLLWLLLILLWLAAMTEHFFWQVKFPVERAALYFAPLFLLLLVQFGYDGRQRLAQCSGRLAGWFGMAAVCGAGLLLIHFFSSLNLNRTFIWYYDAHTKEAVVELQALAKRLKADGPLSLGINWLFEPSVNFYFLLADVEYWQAVDRRGPDGFYDFYYLLPADKDLITKYHLSVIKQFADPETYLAASPAMQQRLSE